MVSSVEFTTLHPWELTGCSNKRVYGHSIMVRLAVLRGDRSVAASSDDDSMAVEMLVPCPPMHVRQVSRERKGLIYDH
jgi:hypothetical protein